IEVLRHPELAGHPVVVGGRGDPTERAVVSTASYEARIHGIRSGMPLKIAVRRCPDAVFLPVDFPVYEAASARVMDTLRAFPGAVVEVLGWDEAFVGIESGTRGRPRRPSSPPSSRRPACTAPWGSGTRRSARRPPPTSASPAAPTD